jgi:hypothetical protein
MSFQNAFDDNVSVTHIFVQEIFRAAEKAPLSPQPPLCCATSHGIGYGFEAVRNRVKILQRMHRKIPKTSFYLMRLTNKEGIIYLILYLHGWRVK